VAIPNELEGTGFFSKRCAEIMGYSETWQGQVIQFELQNCPLGNLSY